MKTKQLQTLLKDKGFYKGTIDGIYGKLTGEAVRAFQKSYGLVVDGIVGIKTTTALLGTNTTSMRQKMYDVAMFELNRGIKEVRGGENPRIIEYHSATTLKAQEDEIPWCSSFVNWVCKQVGVKGTESAMARSWLKWGNITQNPQRGDVVVISRGNNGVSGHVGLVDKVDDKFIWILGGNQGDTVSIVKFDRSRLLGFRTM